MLKHISFIAAVVLPFWNLPLIFRVIKRRSSEDISIFWAAGVWACLLVMAPSSFVSVDMLWRVFSIMNFISFSLVLVTVLMYRKGKIHAENS
ncbi:MAG: hypothetical protein COZ98_00815 [Candidatus Omnitrophica bacterium CG_4_8_14_3_um_filter_43_15]|nr:MAG: hypothetical protein AUJ89_00710 [Candidatus Omnitrophica bacterium CG1_02_43_210]PIR66006.1 MAG: hypothetical protein COU52_01135 [Candidatus Omnitrophica bacterium CG10_big_fil_rev_8_21_14_0_10_43_8]PIV12251.1 MAG: hypothetical protein COS48_01775 [Candidatus Omnitrophica bacterium CG03_land_8_20_14_0_80_43_22]PIW80740.1 MAG: hypothetical protein COZ98_00815 [Candidatus Omnitrophica bacterium CG_4_8_14_3_um_filter_43_15]PIY83588.1 MAG: hypothetical protein COY77_05250 [Candidatus Omni